jgi:GMP synthase (glutamine-hydrolysing)
MRLHWLQHVAFEGLGSIEPWAAARGHQLTATRLHAGEPLPSLLGIDWLVVMGGPMGVHDSSRHPWLTDERRFVEAAIARGLRVLGICLGAQIVADVLGAAVRPNRVKEIGWLPVRATPEAARSPLFGCFPSELLAFHWHGDSFEIPAGAIRMAESDACANQAFVYGERVVALQFHLETTREGASALVTHCPEDLAAGPFVQPSAEILRDGGRFAAIHRVMEALLGRIEAAA